ncbi:hypothetical protein TNCV_1317231 [Trichonephila clavipes]|nr:hypothetical protein TNCV_1317231 [Trichonephila clavipes]
MKASRIVRYLYHSAILQSPDINTIENLWHKLDVEVRKHKISPKDELKRTWHKIPNTLIFSMRNGLQAVINAKGSMAAHPFRGWWHVPEFASVSVSLWDDWFRDTYLWRDIPQGTRPTVPNSVYAPLGPEVHEQMFRSGGQSDVEPPVLSSQASLVLILLTH